MSEDTKSSGPHPNNKESLEQAAMQDNSMQDVHAQLMREKEEPHEGFSPVPIVLMFLFAALCFWGGVYLVHYSAKFRWDAYSPYFDPNADKPAPVEIPLFVRGQKVFAQQCAVCHQASGAGVPGVYPPMVGSSWVTEHPEVLARILINGLNGPIEVKGNTYNGNMPAFGPGGLNLSDKDLAGVMTYIRQEWGNEASDMTVAMVTDYQAAYASRSTPWTAPELKEGLGPVPEPEPVVEEAAEGEAAEAEEPHAEEAAH
ncbi:MAG TPA: cytochrome C [Opitutae bacterium]|nr:cytochrome C [Opitutae bacterium]